MAEADTPSLWQFVPVATTVAGGVLSVVGGEEAAKGAKGAGSEALAAGQRAAAAYRDYGARVAESDRIKASRAKTAAEFAAEQAEVNAGQQLAAAQRDAVEERRQAKLVASRAIAVAAASGAGASDPSVSFLVGRIKGEGTLRAANALYAGEDRARQLRMAAAAKRYEGLTAEEAGELNAQDALASAEAKAVSEEARGVAAKNAGDVAAQTARNRGLQGALPAIGAGLTKAASLFDKYGDASRGWPLPAGALTGSARDSGVSMTEDEAAAADKAFKEDAWAVDNAIAANMDDYYAQIAGPDGADAYLATAVATQDAANAAAAAIDAASLVDDFQWLELLDFAF